jgi:hypothetical protein
VQTALLDGARRRGVAAASLWGHAPHYIQAVPNVKVCHGVLDRLRALVDVPIDLDELQGASRALEARVDEALSGNDELQSYVGRLDAGQLDAEPPDDPAALLEEVPTEIPSTDVILQQVEELLRSKEREAPDEDGEADEPGAGRK